MTKLKSSMNIIAKFSKDESLFGLSNTLEPSKSQKENSGLLRIDSDCNAKSKLLKSQKETVHNEALADSKSYKTFSRKGSESGAPS